VLSLALKGVPLAVLHYRDLGLRPMSDVDLLVEPDDAPRAMAALDRAAWRAKELRADVVARSAATPYRSPDGGCTLDLHWRLEPWVARNRRDRDRELWGGASPFDLRGQPLLTPAPHDLMLHVVLHAFRSDWRRITRWVPDVVILLRSSAAVFDWDALLDRVVRSHLALPVRDALTYVSATFNAPVPPPVLAVLRDSRTSRREAHKYRIASRSRPNRRRFAGDIPAMRIRWSRVTINFTRVGALGALPAFLRSRTHVDRLSALPVVVARRRLGRLHPRRRKPSTTDAA
jgi:hypothetical protein